MAETIVRAAEPKDVDAIVALNRDFHAMHVAMDARRWTTATPPAEAYPEWIPTLTGDAGLALCAQAGDAIVGYLIAEFVPESTRHWSPACVYFHDLYVAPAARRSGVARRMIDGLFAWHGRHHPTLPIRLTSAAGNDAARRFFASLGFRAATVEMIR